MVKSSDICCVPNCDKTREANVILHKFPSPLKDSDRFRSWIYSIGGDVLALANEYIYKYRRVCHIHFEQIYVTGGGTLTNIAVPTLQLKVADELFTMDDSEAGMPVYYDAIVLYAEANQKFVDEMAAVMASKGFRLFTGYRNAVRTDVIPHGPVCEMIASRCKSTILVFSPEFFRSLDAGGDGGDQPEAWRQQQAEREINENKFYTDYAHATKIISKEHLMIPCMYEECEVPKAFKPLHKLYVNSDSYNFYDQLAKVLGHRKSRTPQNSLVAIGVSQPTHPPTSASKPSVAQRITGWFQNAVKRLSRNRPQAV